MSDFVLPDEPSSDELLQAVNVLRTGGSITGSTAWCVTCVRYVNELGPDPDDTNSVRFKQVSFAMAGLPREVAAMFDSTTVVTERTYPARTTLDTLKQAADEEFDA